MSKRKLDKSASVAQPSVVLERPPTPEPDVVDGKLPMKDWEKVVEDINDGSSLAAKVVREAVDGAYSIMHDEYIESELVPFCVTLARRAMNRLLKCQPIEVDPGDQDIAEDVYTAGDEPEPPYLDNFFRGVAVPDPTQSNKAAIVQPQVVRESDTSAKLGVVAKAEDGVTSHPIVLSRDAASLGSHTEKILLRLRQQSLRGVDAAAAAKPSGKDKDTAGPPATKITSSTLLDELSGTALSGAAGEEYLKRLCATFEGLQQTPRESEGEQAQATTRDLERSQYQQVHSRLRNTSEMPPPSRMRPDPHAPLLAEREVMARVSRLDQAMLEARERRSRQLEDDMHGCMLDASGPQFPPPPLRRQADFTDTHRRLQRDRLDRAAREHEREQQRDAAMESFRSYRARCHEERDQQLRDSMARTTSASSHAMAATSQLPPGLTEAQAQALGLDTRGRSKMHDISVNGRVQRPILTTDRS
ncbi:uncharacterized protein LOC135815535 [Sycon ciliatum]|uniref:uncharacterized protein LOC135815535 n=1 Tax=Sycon ciliatum TaxID=27933 RepID=UPI0031F6E656